jgi:hypothetical protein
LPDHASKNRFYFSKISLEIINLLLDRIQKTQVADNEASYLDILSNFMFKSQDNEINALFGLEPRQPFAEGLEPVANGIGPIKYGDSDNETHKIPIHFNYNYLHNVSNHQIQAGAQDQGESSQSALL